MFPACCFRQRTYMVQNLINGVLNETWVSSSLIKYPINKALCNICTLTKVTTWKHTRM